ncbi:MAG: PilX N-terminal domain-containing pilus assembly protein [Halioglobus sp.]
MRHPMRKMNKSKSRGAVLLLAMIFLLLMAMVAATVLQASALEFRMAGNDQFREEAFQKAEGIAAAITELADNFPVSGGVGYTICLDNASTAGCSADLVALGANVTAVPTGMTVGYTVERRGPKLLASLPFRQSQSATSSSRAYDVALFEASVEVDGGTVGLGSAQVAHGVAVVIVSSAQ